MYFSRSLLASAAILSFSATVDATVAFPGADSHVEHAERQSGAGFGGILGQWSLRSLFNKRQQPEELICEDNASSRTLRDGRPEDAQVVCNQLLELPPATVEVDYTPVITRQETATTTRYATRTTRMVTTSTVYVNGTGSTPSLVPRGALAQQASIASDVFTSFLFRQQETDIPSTSAEATPTNTQRDEVVAQMSTACLCLNVDPTSTVTNTFTAPPAQTTVGQVAVRYEVEYVTLMYTFTETVTGRPPFTNSSTSAAPSTDSLSVSATTTANGTVSSVEATNLGSLSASATDSLSASATDSLSASSADPSSAPATNSLSASATDSPSASATSNGTSSSVEAISSSAALSSSAFGQSSVAPTFITDGNIVPLPTNTASSSPLVIGLPFNCPDDNGKRITNIVGDKRYEYEVLCDTAAAESEIIMTDDAAGPTECAAQCSVVNNAFQSDECEIATFTPGSGSGRGICVITRATTNFAASPGTVTLVHTATFGSGDESGNCAAVDYINAPTTASVDTSALVASISSADISLSTPGLMTGSTGGGVYSTYFSTGTIGTDGIYRYSWYAIYASSSSWYQIYATSWSCTNEIPRTIISVDGANATSVGMEVTTIINGDITTIVSGTYTSTYTGGSGEMTPSSAFATTTSGGAAMNTAFSTASMTGSFGEGAASPSATASAATNATATAGSQVVIISGGAATANSTGGNGFVLPTATSGGAEISVSEGIATLNSTLGGGAGVAQSTGAAQFNSSGSASTVYSTGGAGGVTLSVSGSGSSGVAQSTGAGQFNSSGSASTAYSTGGAGEVTPSLGSGSSGIAQSTGAAQFNSSGSASTAYSTGGAGEVTPSLGNGSSGFAQSTGAAQFNNSGSASTVYSTGGAGEIIPTIISGGSSGFAQSTGAAQFNISSGTYTGYSTGGSGEVGTSATSGGASGSIPSSMASSNVTGGGGGYGPAPVSSSTAGGDDLSVSFQTLTVNSTGGFGFELPTGAPSAGTGVFTVSSATAVSNATSGGGAITPPASSPTQYTLTLETEIVVTAPSGSFVLTHSGDFNVINSTGGVGTGMPPASVATPPPSLTPSPSSNSSSTPSGFTFTNTSGDRTGTFSRPASTGGNTTLAGAGSTGIPVPSRNVTSTLGTAEPSVTPPPVSANSTSPVNSTTGYTFTNTDGGRSGTFSRPAGTGSVAPSVNVTSSDFPSASIPASSANVTTTLIVTTTVGSVQPSITPPPVSANSTSPVNGTTGFTFTNSNGGRVGTYSRSGSSGFILPSSNATISASIPVTSNSTLPLPTGGSASLTIPAVSANSTAMVGTGTGASSFPSPTGNFTNTSDDRTGRYTPTGTGGIILSTGTGGIILPTGNSSTPPLAPTISANSTTTPCPTSPTESVFVETILVTHTATITPSICPTANATLPFATGAAAIPTYSTTSTGSLASASAAFSLYRRAGVIATQEQIDAACAEPGNIVFNPDFEIADDNNAYGWSSVAEDSYISFRTISVPGSEQHTPSGSRVGRILSASPGRSVTINTPLTLCPGRQYALSAFNRQADSLAQCMVEYSIGDEVVWTVTPQESWLAGPRQAFYTASPDQGAEGVSLDLNVRVWCAGQGGASVGTDDEGFMRVEIDDVRFEQV